MASFFQLISKNPQVTSSIVISGLISLRLAGQTILLGVNRSKFLQAYKDGVETPVDKNTKNLCQEVLDKFKLRPAQEADTEFFTCFSQNPVYAGSTHLRTGSIIGLPANFAYKSVDDINQSKIQVGQKSINWETPEGKLFAASLVLSDNAKLFAIARQVNYLESLQVYIDNGFLVLFSILGYWAGHAANVLFHLKRKLPASVRVLMYSCIGSIAATFYFLAKDEYFCYLDKKADKKSARLSKGYMEGGVEFYEKELQRNKALRVILGEYGQKVYTYYGNYTSMWRLPNAQPTTRKENIEVLLKEEIEREKKEQANSNVIERPDDS